ncbi:hypothetical protein [Paenibacillus aestuarii]|uniref:Uncharacterized protein n=1 Tax=Paenibacillus aestuarii TaxID=516965 RepID=A0ABW0KHI5_9BACL|nr:hypothetical protein [Paenibacillus aestuarii]
MKATIVGTLVAFRYDHMKTSKIGQADLLQHGDHKFPTTVSVLDVGNGSVSQPGYFNPIVSLADSKALVQNRRIAGSRCH